MQLTASALSACLLISAGARSGRHQTRLAAIAAAPPSEEFNSFAVFIKKQQDALVAALEATDGSATFERDPWRREDGTGEGCMCVLEDGAVWEKAGVGVTISRGDLTEARAKAMSARGRAVTAGMTYQAAALSLVFHAASPMVPTFRADVRVFEVGGERWFGGGADLTPYYLYDEDAQTFHRFWHAVCERHACADHAEYKKWCDDYFYIPSRKEHRGVGGIFFDDLSSQGAQEFTQEVAEQWLASYLSIVEKRRQLAFTEAQRDWQLERRGRYLEFNLLNDRGVRFGLEAGTIDAVERIFVSAPPLIRWKYKSTPPPSSEEEKLVKVLRSPRDWLA